MNVWLCPVRARSLHKIKKIGIFGTSSNKIISLVKPNDLLIFHVLRPVNGIVAVCRVISEVYQDSSDIWGKNQYPFRVKIEFLPDQIRQNDNPISLDILLGNDPNSEFTIFPFLKDTNIAPVSLKQYEDIKKMFLQSNPIQNNPPR